MLCLLLFIYIKENVISVFSFENKKKKMNFSSTLYKFSTQHNINTTPNSTPNYNDINSSSSSVSSSSTIITAKSSLVSSQSRQQTPMPTCISNTTNNYNSLSPIESAILRSANPLSLSELKKLTNQNCITEREEDDTMIINDYNYNSYPINYDPQPQMITKRIEQNIEYIQELAVRYLKPPTPLFMPPPGDIIISHQANYRPPAAPPLIIRVQENKPAITPEPLVVREQPPPRPPRPPSVKVITISGKKLPPPPRKLIVERLPPLPTPPQNVITERWLPYAKSKRRVIFQKAPPAPTFVKPKNVIVQWTQPNVKIKQEIKYLGVIEADPIEYMKKYGDELKNFNEMPDIVRNIPAINDLDPNYTNNNNNHLVHELEGDLHALKLIDLGIVDIFISLNY